VQVLGQKVQICGHFGYLNRTFWTFQLQPISGLNKSAKAGLFGLSPSQ